MAAFLWIFGVFLVFLVIICEGAADLILWILEEETISSWLKKHPEAFWVPASLIVGFLTWLGLHLFVLPPRK